MEILRELGKLVGRWWIALATCFVLASTILLPCIGAPGLWEPTERQLSDRVAPPLDAPEKPDNRRPQQERRGNEDEDCPRSPPKDQTARSLQHKAIEWGRDTISDDDGGRRLPFALLGLLTALAAAGIAIRAGGGRAGLVTIVVLLAMPLMTLQSRMLTSDIGTACGSTLILYALFGLARPSRTHSVLDLIGSGIALCCGLPIAFYGGGAFLGLLVPIGAFAAAGSLGVPLVVDAIKKRSVLGSLPAAVATIATIVIASVLAHQLYYLVEPYPGLTPPPARQMFGKAIVAEGCWSSALGGLWRAEDDVRFIFDSTFEHIAYGTFPWGILAPIAMFGLIRSEDASKRLLGGIALAWAGAAWIANEAFQRKVGYAIFAGFPALAIAVGVWVDDLLAKRARLRPGPDTPALPAGAILVGLFALLGALDIGKDLQSFTEKLTSLLTGSEIIVYPKEASLVLPIKLWVLVLGVGAVLSLSLSLWLWRPGDAPVERMMRRSANVATAAMFGISFLLAAFWSFAWQPGLAVHLSSKGLFALYDELRTDEKLIVMGDLGHAARSYTAAVPEQVTSRDQVVAALKRKERVFAIAPQTELCVLHREMADQPYFVLEDRNLRNLLLTNQLGTATDKNPLREMIAHKPPANIPYKPKARIVFENKLELLGWDLPQRVERGDNFEVVTYWKILSPVGGAWTMLMHFDGPLRLRDGDHKPIKDRCPTSSWQPGDYIIDRHVMKTGGGGFPAGKYDLWIGFFTGSAPNFRNMPISMAPGDMRDTTDRAKITSIILD